VGARVLVNYGIQNENTDLRIHVSVSNKTIYVFRTSSGKKEVEKGLSGAYPFRSVNSYGQRTAEGYIVPIPSIEGISIIEIPQDIFENAHFEEVIDKKNKEKEKGDKAVFVVVEMLKRDGLINIQLVPEKITDTDLQISGLDILVKTSCRIQVKCDLRAGITGNLFLQTAEINPMRLY